MIDILFFAQVRELVNIGASALPAPLSSNGKIAASGIVCAHAVDPLGVGAGAWQAVNGGQSIVGGGGR